ncbi:MAG: hypothetical protein J3Q66DRAFT_181056 [Benniella sp.]|nr:MAG: hypothetical protein J3Q66DRAFT_181056 [Benniella sp.]
MDTLLGEIKRLAAHEFEGLWKPAPYPVVLEPLYQRLYDYHVLLKSARKRVGADGPPHPHSVQASPIIAANGAKSRLGPFVDPTSTSGSNSVATLMAVSTILPPSQNIDGRDYSSQQGIVDQLQERVRDLEKQLAQSRRAHHTLLQEHLLTFAGASAASLSTAVPMNGFPSSSAATTSTSPSTPLPLRAPATMTFTTSTTTTTTMTTTTMVMANLAQTDSTAIRSILASVPSSEIEGLSALEKGLPCTENILSKSQISLRDSLQMSMDTLHARQQTQPHHSHTTSDESSSFMSAINTTTATTATRARKAHLPCSSSSAFSPSNASLSQLVTVKDDPGLLVEGLNRLLRAETELGLLKLVMAQSQREISGLEEEVFRKQAELRHHRQVYEYLLELNRLEYEAQIWEERVKIQEESRQSAAGTIEGRGKGEGRREITCGQEDVKVQDITMKRVKDLEGEVAELQQRLARSGRCK